MANRYWVGGTATWDTTAGTKWATTSGGAGGASVPTSADDVYFDAASGAVTVTIGSGATGKSLICTGFTGTINGSAQWNLWGGLTLVSGMTFSYTGTLTFSTTDATAYNITTAGKTLPAVFFGNSAPSTGSWTLQDALTASGTITVNLGTFTTNNYAVTAASISSSNSNTRTINLGSSTVTLSINGSVVNFATNTNLTFNSGTSTIIGTNLSATWVGGAEGGQGVTFYNISATSTTASTCAVQGINTFNNITVTAPSSAGVTQFTFNSRQTINGTLSTTGTAGNRRVWFRGATYGIAQTLTINSAPSLTDADFRDIYVIGTAAPISGTRIGDLRGIRGITASTPKTVYWVTAAGGNWSGTNWATSAGGAVSDNNFPLAQDTATIVNTGLNTSATITVDAAIGASGLALPSVDMSARTNAMTLATGAVAPTIYGSWTNGSGTSITGSAFTFSGRNTQTITSAGKTFPGNFIIDSYGGTVQLADALNIGTNTLTVTNGTFDTKNFDVTAGALSSSNSNVRTISLGSSTVTLSGLPTPINFTTSTNLTFNCGTSSISSAYTAGATFQMGGQTFYDITQGGASAGPTNIFSGSFTCRNLTLTGPSSANIISYTFSANVTITGTLTISGATAVRRIFVRSDTLGTTRTLTVNSLSATDCDFRDITIAGTAAGSSPTRAGDCGGNTGITFPVAKTVYWNLAGTQNWSATGWATSSGGSPAVNNFPLAQDTAVFDNTGSAGTINIDAAWNTGVFNGSARTSALVFNAVSTFNVYGSWSWGTGFNSGSNIGVVVFAGRGTSTITNNGVNFGMPITVDCATGTVQLADALTVSSIRNLTLTSGTFDAVSYNVTTGNFAVGSSSTTLKMGSGTWTISGTGAGTWSLSTAPAVFYKGTANIILSDTGTTARTFAGGNLSYNKLTIGGTTGTSTLTITGNNQFTELASTKTVAHTIALGATAQTLGKWSVTGTVGNVVTVTGTAAITIAGARVSGVDYLALGTTVISVTSPGEFYAGANSTGGTNAILTAAPAAVTRYWRGGTGTWDATTTTNWSATSGGAGGASVPTSADAVVFDSASNATAYTVTCTATQLRCASLTISGPASGNVTWAGTAPLAIHDNVSLSATGITNSYTGSLTLTGSTTGKTFTVNGVNISSTITVNGVGSGWTLGSALSHLGNGFTLTNGSFSTGNYAWSPANVTISTANEKTLNLGSSSITLNSSAVGWSITNSTNLTFNAGTSTITDPSPKTTGGGFSGAGLTYYNVAFTNSGVNLTFTGSNTFNNLTIGGRSSAGVQIVQISANQTINGTLTLSAGTDATCRTFVQSDTLGTTRTLTCAAFSATDADFRDITIAGAAAPASGTRLGDCKGNSGITFPAAKTVYYVGIGGGNWGSTGGWAFTSGGTADATAVPLAQDTAIIDNAKLTSGSTITVNAAYNIGTIDMSARTSNTMTLATGTTTPTIYGNWINGTGTTLTGTGIMTFAGRGSQTITSAGKTFTQGFTINTPGWSVSLSDAFTSSTSSNFQIIQGTFDAVSYNFSLTLASVLGNAGTSKTIAIGSGTWTLGSSGTVFNAGASSNTTVTGIGTISLTSASAKTFAGGGLAYTNITLDQGGAGTLTITGNNTFKDITNSYKSTGATNITLGTTTQTVTQWTGTGTSGKVLTVQGTSASSPSTLILSGATDPNVDYLAITGVRAYSLTDTWYAGANSTNNGSLGWYFESAVVPPAVASGSFLMFFN